MKKVAIAAAAALLLAGCSAQSGDAKALNECKDLVASEYPGYERDTSGLVAESLTDALFESGVTKERDSSRTVYAVSGSVTLLDGTLEKRVTAICQVIIEDGEITESSISAA